MPERSGCARRASPRGVRCTSDSGNDNIYIVANAINGGTWGYNNLQWYGLTYYHKFNDQWHISFETYNLHQNNVLNAQQSGGAAAFIARAARRSRPQYMPFNAPGLAQCSNADGAHLYGRSVQTYLMYLNYKPTALDNISYRARVLRRQARPAHRHQDALCRNRHRLAALVLAADRDPARSSRTTGRSMRTRSTATQPRHRAEPETTP